MLKMVGRTHPKTCDTKFSLITFVKCSYGMLLAKLNGVFMMDFFILLKKKFQHLTFVHEEIGCLFEIVSC